MKNASDILDYWFEKRIVSNATRISYGQAMKQYSSFIGKRITELNDEAAKEE
jgi:hypothetical protein